MAVAGQLERSGKMHRFIDKCQSWLTGSTGREKCKITINMLSRDFQDSQFFGFGDGNWSGRLGWLGVTVGSVVA